MEVGKYYRQHIGSFTRFFRCDLISPEGDFAKGISIRREWERYTFTGIDRIQSTANVSEISGKEFIEVFKHLAQVPIFLLWDRLDGETAQEWQIPVWGSATLQELESKFNIKDDYNEPNK